MAFGSLPSEPGARAVPGGTGLYLVNGKSQGINRTSNQGGGGPPIISTLVTPAGPGLHCLGWNSQFAPPSQSGLGHAIPSPSFLSCNTQEEQLPQRVAGRIQWGLVCKGLYEGPPGKDGRSCPFLGPSLCIPWVLGPPCCRGEEEGGKERLLHRCWCLRRAKGCHPWL